MHQFSKKDLDDGKKLVASKEVLSILFSEGTYQVEVLASKKPKNILWPFLQIADSGEVIDAFCTCETAEKKGSCPHLAAALLKIGKDDPLHMRFRRSLWKHITWILAERYGYDAKAFKKTKEGYVASGFFLKGGKELQKILFDRAVETEETSLKFSNLPAEEMEKWREGKPSKALKYELSFWSDLAKWWMQMQDDGAKYSLEFSKEAPPENLKVIFPKCSFSLSIERKEWPELIPTLKDVKSPVPVHFNGMVKGIFFSEEKGTLSLESEGKPVDMPEKGGVELGEWVFFEKEGFFRKNADPLLQKPIIEKAEVGRFLEQHLNYAEKYLTIHPRPIQLRYSLQMNQSLHIEAYAFEKGDLKNPPAHYFGNWIYLPNQGFYKIDSQEFDHAKVEIPKDKISEFISSHKIWLYGYEGFQTHVSGVESHLGFKVENNKLIFFTRHEFTEAKEHIMDLGDWIYVKGKGFYEKVTARPGAHVKPGMEIEKEHVSSFINDLREELESIPRFFSYSCPLEKSGLNIGFNNEGRIEIHPEYFFAKGYSEDEVKIFGDYAFVEKEGFSSIPHSGRLPESYKSKKVIDIMQEAYFVAYELELLYPHVLKIDPKLERPRKLFLRLNGLKRQAGAKTGQWVLELVYESNIGQVSPFTLWQAIWQGKQYFFSDAGLILLRGPRFDWLKAKHKKKWLLKGEALRFTTLEFFKLTAFEEVLEPVGDSRKEKSTRKLYQNFLEFKAPSEIDLTGLKSNLRAYQKTGVSWLWFLYSYGLSGLLCDEMGLGKTHQAMALIAGIKNNKKEKKAKFLVVCPTSVIYHWEKLIQTFLPEMRPYVFHGIGRKFSAFSSGTYDLLLTSYGIVRTENEALSGVHFDLAVFDELQIAKNAKSLTNKALHNIKAAMLLGLSGTPIENRLLELKALFDLVLPSYLPKMSTFREIFVNPIEKHQDEQQKYLLSKLIHPFLLRRKKSEVLTELPEKMEEVVLCDLAEDQRTLYMQIVQKNRDALLKELEDSSKPPPIAHIFSMLSKLKQVCDHPTLINKDKKNYEKYGSGKWELFKELLDETRDSGQKLVVFTQYLDMLDIMGAYLKEKEIGFAEIRGSTRDRKRQVETFGEDPKCEVFLGSLQAAGVGIDLIAASVVIHYDRWWNPAKENQATDRVHRMGQKRGVQVFKFVTKDTIEEQIHLLIEKKLSLVAGVIGFDAEDHVKGLDRQELIELLRVLH